MSNNEWVQEGTPRDGAEWTDETDDYGVPVEPAEWDDYSSEQAMPVPAPPAQPVTDHATIPTAPDPDDVVAGEDEPVSAEDQPASTMELGEAPEEVDGPADLHEELAEPVPAETRTGATLVDDNELPELAEPAEEPVEEPADEPLDDEPTTVRDPEHSAFGRPATDPDATTSLAAVGAGVAGAAGAGAGGVAAPAMAGLYRADADETQVLDTTAERRSLEDEAAEEEARAAALRAEKEERDRRLGMVATSQENAERELRPRSRGVGPFGSFGLFVLRLVTAGILGIVAYQVLYSIDATAEFLSGQPLIPEPRLVSWIIGFTLAAMAVMLVIGLGVRVVGFVLAALAIAALVLIRWGSFSPFVDGMEGFLGDKDLLLAAVGILFLSMGGGRFGIDGALHRSREDAREARRN